MLQKIKIIEGGNTRAESVRKALNFVSKKSKYVCIHDSVRPLVAKKLIKKMLKILPKYKALIPAVPVKDTIKIVSKNHFVDRTLPRDRLYAVQTPQMFEKKLLISAYKKNFKDATDDSYLLEKINVPVKVVKGDYKNIKLTSIEDLPTIKKFIKK